ncbi:MAG: diguanylate cyclase [Betaproteobacteria bacterium]|nr:MAG: diguanylate cyclase [Betaproteobacteria bacterium]
MSIADIALARTLRLIAAAIAIIVAVSLPLGYWLVVYSFAAEAAANDAAALAELVTQRINADPELWRFEIPRLDAIVAARTGTGGLPEKHFILDERGAVLVQDGENLSRPILTRSAPLLDSGTVVGRFVTSRSLVPLLQDTALVALFGLVLALAVYISLSLLPLRALTRVLGALRQERERLRAIVDHAVEGIITFDLQGKLQSLNPAAERMFDYGSAEVLGRSAGDLLPEIDLAGAGLPDGKSYLGKLETLGRRKDGTDFPIELALSQAMLEGKPHLIAIAHDITVRKQAEQALRDSAEELRLFADNVPAMTVSYDENLHCRFANKAFAEFFGFTVENILGKHLREVAGEDAYREIEGHSIKVLQGHPVTYQRTRKLANGESRYLEVKVLPHTGDQGRVLGLFAVIIDITEHKLAEERIWRVAHQDSLTGLPNRMLFNDRLDQAISLAKRDSRQFALLYLDLDRFKPVNDSLGHTAGDELLQAVAVRIRQQVRESDTVARVGGDEFTVILPDIAKREEAETVAKKIIAAVAAPFQLGSRTQSVGIGTSIGIALYPTDARDTDALVKAADAAMYRAKQVGSSYRFFAA